MFLTFLKATDCFHIIYNNKITGKRNRKNTGTNDKDKADDILNDFQSQYNADKSSALPSELCQLKEQEQEPLLETSLKISSMQSKIIDYYFTETNGDIKRTKELNRIFRYMIECWGDIPINKVTPYNIEEFKQWKLKQNPKMKLAGCYVYLRNIKAIFNKFVSWGFLEVSPFKLKIPQSNKNGTRISFTDEELIMLFFVLKNNQNLYNISYLSYKTGMRLGECVNLQWKDINFEENKILLRNKESINFKTKSRKSRVIKLNPELKAFLQDLKLKDRFNNFVICKQIGGYKYDKDYISRKFCMYVYKAGIRNDVDDKSKTFHSLRHSFASSFLKFNSNIETLRSILGHTDIKTTQIYTHSTESEQQICMDNIKYAI